MKLGSPGFVADRLREAREVREESVTALAEAVGVSRQSITKYEKGLATPQPEVVLALATALEVPEEFFFVESLELPDAEVIHFRALKKTPKKARVSAQRKLGWAARLAYFLSDYVSMPDTNVPRLGGKEYEDLSNEDIEVIAAKVRRYWHLGDGPISDLALLAENNGVLLSAFRLSDDQIDGFSLWDSKLDRPIVVLNTSKSDPQRSRFDLAHELGHMVMHRGLTARDQRDRHIYGATEAQAHQFASSFLLPTDSFLRDFSVPDLDVFAELKPKWKVSVKAMIYKCKSAGVLPQKLERNLWVSYARRGWNTREPFRDTSTPEHPRFLGRALSLLESEGITDLNALASEVALPVTEVSELLGVSNLSKHDTATPTRSTRDLGDVIASDKPSKRKRA